MNIVKKNLLTSSIAFYVIQLLNILSPLLVLPFLSRSLSVDGFGKVMLFNSLCGIVYIINDFGFGLSATHSISKNREDKLALNRIVSSIFILKIPLFILSSLGVIVYLKYYSNITYDNTAILCLLGVSLFQSLQPLWLFQGLEIMKKVIALFVIPKIGYIFYILYFIHDDSDLNKIYFSLFFCMLLNFIFLYFSMKKIEISFTIPENYTLRYIFKDSSTFFLSRAAVSIYTSVSSIIIGNYSGLIQLALYSCAEKIYQGLQSITGPISQAIFPYLSFNKDHKLIIRLTICTLPILLLISAIIFIFSKDIITIIFGLKYVDSYEILNIFSITMIINYIGVNFGYPAFAAINNVRFVNLTVIIGAFFQILLLLILISNNKISAINIAYSVLITESIVASIRVYFFLRKSNSKKINNSTY